MTRLAQADVLRRVSPEMEQVPPTPSVGLHLRMAPDAEDAVAMREQIIFLKRRASQIH